MAPPNSIADYTNRDFASLVTSLLDLAALKLPEWTDRSENDLGRMLVELFAYVGDNLLYYQDRIANEAFLATAVERRSVIDLLALIGYTLATPAPAVVELEVRIANDEATPAQIEPGARFATQALPGKPAIEFIYLPNPAVPRIVPRDGGGGLIPPFTIRVTHASRIERELLGTATGQANQRLRLGQTPVMLPRDGDSQEGLTVEVDRGSGFERWDKRATLLYSHSRDTHFTVQVDDQDRVDVVFGDGQYGAVPPAGGVVRASYLIGGGAAGNVGPGTITAVMSGVSADAMVVNRKGASGGTDRESIEHARQHAPRVFRSLQRAVTAGDYAALATNVPGVLRAVAIAPGWNYVDLYVVAEGGLELTEDLRATLLRYFDTRRMLTTFVSIRQPVFVSVDLTVHVEALPTFYQEDVRQRVAEDLAALFDAAALDFGRSFYLSKIYEVVQEVEGVAFAQVLAFQGRRSQPVDEIVVPPPGSPGVLQLAAREFPRAGNIVVTATKGLT